MRVAHSLRAAQMPAILSIGAAEALLGNERVARREDLTKREASDLRREVRDLARDLFEVGALELV